MSASSRTGPIDRARPNDLTNLAVDRGPAPMNIGAVLILDDAGGLGPADVRSLIAARLPRVPRMRQRLVPAPIGAGRPLWVDDAGFDLDRHLTAREVEPGDDGEAAIMRVAAELVCRHLPRDRPLWRAGWVTGAGTDHAALVLVVHHTMADGIGGLAVLAALADDGAPPPPSGFPQPGPSRGDLAADAWRERAHTLRRAGPVLRRTVHGVRELGMGTRPRLAPASSLNRPTGPHRRLTTVGVPLADVVGLAHTHGATVNDVVLTAIVGALGHTLVRRGEDLPAELVVSVPVSSRRGATVDELGNQTGAIPLMLPTTQDPLERLDRIAAISRARRGAAPGASAAPLGLVFRTLGRLGLFQPFIDRQRLVNTFVTNVRGPATRMALGGHPVAAVIPIAVNPGNVGVSFDVLSYDGRLGVTVVADPDVVPDQDLLTDHLAAGLRAMLGP